MRFMLLALFIAVLGCKGNSASAASKAYAKPVKGPKGLAPAPIIGRGKSVATSKRMSGGDRLVDGKYRANAWEAGLPTADKPAWAAVDVGQGPSRLLVAWTSSFNFPYNQTEYGGPGAYRLETSADSTDGEDGTWALAAEVKDNAVRARSHLVKFEGQRWLRLSVLGPSKETNKYGVKLDELDVHDVSAGAEETFLFLGDSITAFSYDRADAHQPSVADLIAQKHPGHYPAMLNAGIGFEKASDGLKRVADVLAQNEGFKVVCLGYGTNDAAGNGTDTADYEKNLRALGAEVKTAGRTPVIARIPFAPKEHDGVGAFNAVVDRVTKDEGLVTGPDLYAHFKAHPDELSDGLHPNDKGIQSINRLWAQALEALY